MQLDVLSVLSALLLASQGLAQGTLPPSGICATGAVNPRYNLNVGSGWRAGGVLSNLRSPRGITMDSEGNLLVVQSRTGISIHTLNADGCVSSSKTLVSQTDLNHGIYVSPDGKTLFASSMNDVFSWTYDAAAQTVSNRKTLITGMPGTDHVSRTLLITPKAPDVLVVSRGSQGNLDTAAAQASTGRAIVKVFNISSLGTGSAVQYASGGKVLGYGLRNDVGLAYDRAGNVWSVENSADNIRRNNADIHNDNPGEPIWNLGDPANPSGFYGGYPTCFLAWSPSLFRGESVQTGQWFVQSPSGSQTDAWCNSNTGRRPSAMLPPHTAPLDIKFGVGDDTAAYVALHGSWNRQPPSGYKVVRFPGTYAADGTWVPTAGTNVTNGFTELIRNNNEGSCGTGCFRPVGLVFDSTGTKLYVSSDTSGEVFLLRKIPQ